MWRTRNGRRATKASTKARLRRVAIASALLAGSAVSAVGTAGLIAGPDDQQAVPRAIAKQHAENGESVVPEPDIEHQVKAFTPDQMIELAKTYEAEMQTTLEHGEMARLNAYRSRDLIRMSCIDQQLYQIRTVIEVAQPRFLSLQSVRHEELAMRGQFILLHQAWDRVRDAARQLEACVGESLEGITMGNIGDEGLPGMVAVDPTVPARPETSLDRPPEASTYQ